MALSLSVSHNPATYNVAKGMDLGCVCKIVVEQIRAEQVYTGVFLSCYLKWHVSAAAGEMRLGCSVLWVELCLPQIYMLKS